MKIPFEYILGFLQFLKKNDEIIEVITYEDLPWGDDYGYEKSYQLEFKNWKQQLASGERDKNKIYVLLQQDVDSFPQRSMAVMNEQAKLGIFSTFMIFNKGSVNRRKYSEGILELTSYPLDFSTMEYLEREKGFVFGYHCNAFEKALFDREKALQIFEEDVKLLRQYFKVNYFSAHGGVKGPNGELNRDLGIPSSLNLDIRWVHNGGTPIFDGNYSDGGWGSSTYGLRDRDIRSFVATWKQGNRYRVLTHPQYYNTPCTPADFYVGQLWHDEIINYFIENPGSSVWEDFKLSL